MVQLARHPTRIGGTVLIICLTVVLGAHACQAQPRKVTIAQAGDFFLYLPLYLAIDGGFFKERNLEVSLVTTGGDEKTWAAVISGNAAFGVADPTFIAVSEARGQGGKVIASIVNGVPFWGITFRKDIPTIKKPEDLGKYSVGTFPAPSTAYTLQAKMFRDGQLEPRIRQGAFGTLLSMLRAGHADIALELEPNVSQAVKQGARVLYSLKDVYGDFAITGLTATEKFLETKADVAADIVCALQKTLGFVRADHDRALSLLARRFPDIDREVANVAFGRVTSEGIVPTTVATKEESWAKAITLRVNAGDIKQAKSFQTYVDNQFAVKAETQCAYK